MPANHTVPHTAAAKAKMSAAKKGKANVARRRESKIVDGATHWKCGRCGEFFPVEGFYRNKRTLLGITSECRKCHCQTSIKSRDKDSARDANRVHMAKARRQDPERFRERERAYSRKRVRNDRVAARQELNYAVRSGRVAKPDYCATCGSNAKLTAHHDDYSKPLDVRWLCYSCHGKEHRKEPA